MIVVALDARSFAILEPARNANYGREELSSARDRRIHDLLLGVNDSAAFTAAVRLLPRDADRVLNAFAERAASIAVRVGDRRELRVGLLAAALAQAATREPREGVAALVLLHRASVMLGDDPAQDFGAVAKLAGADGSGLLGFLRRSPADKTIEAMDYREGEDKGGFRFMRNW